MKSAILNTVFVVGLACVVASAFMVAIPLGLLVLGVPLIALSLHAQIKVASK